MTTASPSGVTPVDHPFGQDGLFKNPLYHRLRETGTGVTDIVRANGTHAKLITRYDDVVEVMRDQRTFSRQAALDVDEVDLGGTLLGLDGEEHAAVRDVVKGVFTPNAVGRMRHTMEEKARARLRSMTAAGDSADLIEAFALPFALNTITDLLGLPTADRPRFRQWVQPFLATSTATREDAHAARVALAGYFATLIEQRHREPGPDLLSRIATAAGSLPPDHLIKLPIALLVGGWEAVATSIATYTEVLLTQPYDDHATAYAYLTAYPEAVPGAVTEMERMFSTSAADDMPRRVLRDVVLPSGAVLRPGDVVIPSHDAANHDPRVFSDPLRMDFTRASHRHLSFGHGVHHCIGRHLGHIELVTAMTLLTGELPDLRLAVPADRIPRRSDHLMSGPAKLPVRWT
ncbi:cytochrome P450 [Sphaerisporangium krabiense]|uniref:Cytochrome P450 n=1 Tax=Sphaerisporangium krabiense TaxID=763782 RepID=A0A7W9DNU7_9ACTN|nr:cytochrome P450 [Sphaerisporangium krabiense]MBB5625717.1 cytochrome P450 [Sphaerisporangium krabiense]GII62947.1 cytochrome P450 [Sphaerisporangium krabiense]